MKTLISIAFIFLVLGTTACSNLPHEATTSDLVGLWTFLSSDPNDVYAPAHEKTFLNLREDGNFTLYLPSYFDFGRWHYEKVEKLLVLSSERPQKLYFNKWKFNITSFTNKAFKATLPGLGSIFEHKIAKDARKERVTFRLPEEVILKKERVQFDPRADPFMLQNNLWRIYATHKESCEELKKRVLNHIQHMYLLFEGYTNSGSSEVSWAHSPTPLQLASNGMQLLSFDGVPFEYKDVFYDQEDQIEAYYLAEDCFRLKISLPSKPYEKYTMLWASILKQMMTQGQNADLCKMFNDQVAKFKADSIAKSGQGSFETAH